MGKEKVLITAALPYINNVPHMGHIVGSHLPADVFYRYNKLIGNDAIFIGGSDEHGTPAMVTASEVGMNVKDLVDMLKVKHKEIYDKLNISYTNYSGTSSPVHSEVTADFFKTLDEKGYIEEKEMEMFYCDNCKMFLPDRFVVGTCPYCGYEQANGDQCEKCGRVFANAELLNPKCKTCGQTPTIKKSKHLFFNLEKTKDMLNSWIESKKDIFRPYVYAEAKRWINEGLKSRCITRDILWGIPVNKQGYENKVFYVWFEAPIGYISFVKELGDDMLKKYWLDKDAKIYHFLGKDNIPFHAVFFPAMLLANGNYNMPYNVIGYNFLNYEGQKFSKSRKIGVFCNPLLDSDIEIDALRAYLVSILPENKDTDWIWNEFKNCTNSELIGKFSNLFNRTINMIYKNFPNGLDFDYTMLSDLTDEDKTMVDDITNGPKKVLDLYQNVELRDAYKEIVNMAVVGNVYLERTAPWTLIKNGDMKNAQKVLYLCLNLCKALAILASPIIPSKMEEVWTEQLNFAGKPDEDNKAEDASKINIEKGHKVLAPKPLFRRIDDDYLKELIAHFSIPYEIKPNK